MTHFPILINTGPGRNEFWIAHVECPNCGGKCQVNNHEKSVLHRHWGRIGTKGHRNFTEYDTQNAAQCRRRTEINLLRYQGYRYIEYDELASHIEVARNKLIKYSWCEYDGTTYGYADSIINADSPAIMAIIESKKFGTVRLVFTPDEYYNEYYIGNWPPPMPKVLTPINNDDLRQLAAKVHTAISNILVEQ